MHIKSIITSAVIVAVLFTGCKGSADSKVPQLAKEMCGCFSSLENGLTEKEKVVFKAVSVAENGQAEMTKGMAAFSPEEATAFGTKLSNLGKGEIADCMSSFEKKHATETTTNKDEFLKKVLAAMRTENGCYAGAAVINLGIKK